MKIEKELTGIRGVKEVLSSSAEGMSLIVVEFTPDVPTDVALQRVRDRVDLARGELPEDVEGAGHQGDQHRRVPDHAGQHLRRRLARAAQGDRRRPGGRHRDASRRAEGGRAGGAGARRSAWRSTPTGWPVQPDDPGDPGVDPVGEREHLRRRPGDPGHQVQRPRSRRSSSRPRRWITCCSPSRDGKPIYLADVATVRDTFKDRESYLPPERRRRTSR